ncbi:MAG: three-Cys-motif partner protein TcmP [Lentisphaerae bacterium]|nr:three-Cys-motif partner protein TcmP [Lentisphaerota bacterium]
MTLNSNFFAEKRDWSKLKDQILDHYLAPYLAKIKTTGRPTRIADCFAGKGRFDDGQPGSPLIIAQHVASILARNPALDVKAVFIEQKYATELRTNLATAANCRVIEGEYEQCVRRFLSEHVNRDRNYFFYMDPYGFKSLSFDYFARLKEVGFRSLEMLINLNSTGFLREGCRLLNLTCAVPDWADDLDFETDGKNHPARMNEVAGGDYWQAILADFQAGTLDFHQAEEKFIAGYTDRLVMHFKYVVNIPIKERSHHMPKYRLVFATDHHEGLFLMADDMHAAWRKLLEQERGGQLYLFSDEDLEALRGATIHDKVFAELQVPLHLRELLIRLIKKHGIAHTTGEYKKAIKEGEGDMFSVTRDPAKTPTGRPSLSMDHNKGRIIVSVIPQEPVLLQS